MLVGGYRTKSLERDIRYNVIFVFLWAWYPQRRPVDVIATCAQIGTIQPWEFRPHTRARGGNGGQLQNYCSLSLCCALSPPRASCCGTMTSTPGASACPTSTCLMRTTCPCRNVSKCLPRLAHSADFLTIPDDAEIVSSGFLFTVLSALSQFHRVPVLFGTDSATALFSSLFDLDCFLYFLCFTFLFLTGSGVGGGSSRYVIMWDWINSRQTVSLLPVKLISLWKISPCSLLSACPTQLLSLVSFSFLVLPGDGYPGQLYLLLLWAFQLER